MKTVHFLLLLFCCSFSVAAQSFLSLRPYLQNPARDGVTVMWRTADPAYSWIEYGTDSIHVKVARTVEHGIVLANITRHKVRINGLAAGQKYYYRVCSQKVLKYEGSRKEFDKPVKTRFYSFSTLDDKGTDFTCIIFNDLHSNLPVFDLLCKQLKDVAYDFVVFNGDCFQNPSSDEHEAGILAHYTQAMNAADKPLIFMRGNHEIRGVYATGWPSLVDWDGDQPYFSFSFGDTRFVFLDCGEDKNDNHVEYSNMNEFDGFRNRETSWLMNEITQPSFRNAARRILIQHIPIYSWDNSFDPGFIPCRDLWDPIYKKTPFDINITGHLHWFNFYAAGKADNPFPLVVGGGNDEQSARVMILQKKGNKLVLKAIDCRGKAESFDL
ncbi:MAG: metallophosphoesterase [Bacteroidales bacterium]|jgi:predicted phosphodiesterase|nr:metallophosphoesterase [Bacteroidales bacterium]